MYEFQGLHDPLFLTLYVAAACMALVAAALMLAIVAFLVWRAETLQELTF